MMDSTRRSRSNRLAMLTLLTWWSSQQAVDASLSLQHRVKSSQRKVPYRHVLQGQSRGSFSRVQHSGYEDTHNRKNSRQHPLHREEQHDEAFWVLHVTARKENPNNNNERKTIRRRNLGKDTPSFWRRLFDQFVGEEITPGVGNVNSTNVTTEVEFESTNSNNTSNSTDLNGSDSYGANETLSGPNATSITGNATEAGNIYESVVFTKPVDGQNNTSQENNTAANVTEFQPLRIRAILAEESGRGNLLNETERNALFHDMLSPALLAWSSSLRVDPVVGNLTVDVTQLLDGETCGPGIDSGLPSIQVPLHHIVHGIPETDMIVYLSLGFATKSFDKTSQNETSSDGTHNRTNSGYVGLDENVEDEDLVVYDLDPSIRGDGMGAWIKDVFDEGNRKTRYLSSHNSSQDTNEDDEFTMDESTGPLSEAAEDAMANYTNETESINICTGDYLAASSYCSSDQYDRPIAALLHICIDETFFDPKHLRRNILTLMHELGHALGFNSLSMSHFRRPDGRPYTRRDRDGNVPEIKIECTGPKTNNQQAIVPLPSDDILRFREVRGGVRVAEIVTPSVLQVVRNQFDCQLLTGAELESGEGLPLSVTGDEGCIGDHWERRLFSSDLMNPIVDDLEYSTRISTLTLAYFADSGWYQVDLTNAEVASGWGRGVGCNFVNDPCINDDGEVPPQNIPFFCNEIPQPGISVSQDIHGCTPDLSRKATCSIGQYDLDLPLAYQYFNLTYGADVGGSDTFMDFCPVYFGYDNGLCSSKENEAVIKTFEGERFGQRNSRCLIGSVRPFFQPTALCLPIACVIQDHSLRIKVEDAWHVCERQNQKIISGSVTIDCPDKRRVCPTFFCPYDCLGTDGQCSYDDGKCLCEYKNLTDCNSTFLDECGLLEEDFEWSTLRPILRPDEPGKKDPAVPPPDTILSDYYVVDAQSLDETSFLEPFVIALVCVTAVLIISFLFFSIYIRKSPKSEASADRDCFSFFCKKLNTDESNSSGPNVANPNKDKMVATVLVDMRIQNNVRWRRAPQTRDTTDSLAETEDRLTESEVASGPETMSDVSSRRSECLSDVDASQDDINVEDLPSETAEQQVIRRRRVLPDVQVQ